MQFLGLLVVSICFYLLGHYSNLSVMQKMINFIITCALLLRGIGQGYVPWIACQLSFIVIDLWNLIGCFGQNNQSCFRNLLPLLTTDSQITVHNENDCIFDHVSPLGTVPKIQWWGSTGINIIFKIYFMCTLK